MKKIMVSRFGGPEVLELQEANIPQPEADEVVIRVAYVGVGAIDAIMRAGGLKEANLRPPFTPGIEVSGTIHAVGSSVSEFEPGQFVAAIMPPEGGYAEYVRTKATLTVGVSSETDLPATASIVNLVTAYLLFTQFAEVNKGDKLAVHGASGGLGTACVQVALLLQPAVQMTATVRSEAKKEYVRQLGCPNVLTSDEFTQSSDRKHDYAVVVDPIGGGLRQASLNALRPYGKLLVVGNVSDDYQSNISAQQLWLEGKTVTGFNLALYASLFGSVVNRAMQTIVEALATRKLQPTPTKIFEFVQVAEAHKYLASGGATGRTLLRL